MEDKDLATVLIVLSIQLIFTCIITAIFMFIDSAKEFMLSEDVLYVAVFVPFLVIAFLIITKFRGINRTKHVDIISIILLTLGFSYTAAYLNAGLSGAVFVSSIFTAGMMIFIGYFATTAKFDLTKISEYPAWVGLMVLIILTLGIVLTRSLESIIVMYMTAYTLAIIVAMWYSSDIQMLMGGRTVEMGGGEILNATMRIYFDIMFFYVCSIFLFIGFHTEFEE